MVDYYYHESSWGSCDNRAGVGGAREVSWGGIRNGLVRVAVAERVSGVAVVAAEMG